MQQLTLLKPLRNWLTHT